MRSESGTYFTPRHSVRMLGRTLWNSACRWAHPRAPRRRRAAALRRRARADARRACSFCRRSAKAHTAEGRCQSFDDEVSKIMCVAASADGALLAWGTDTGMLSVVAVDTGDQLALWKGHYGPVYSINFSPNHKSLVSCGRDLNPTMPPDQVRAPRPALPGQRSEGGSRAKPHAGGAALAGGDGRAPAEALGGAVGLGAVDQATAQGKVGCVPAGLRVRGRARGVATC